MLDATPLLRLYARRRLRTLAAQAPVATQRRQLLGLVRRAANTRFGRDHGFAGIRSVEAFQAQVPLRRYEDLWRAYWQPAFPRVRNATWPGTIPFFAVTSGTTTGVTKYIPVTRPMVAGNRQGGTDLLVFHLASQPGSRVLGGYNFMLGGSAALEQSAPGVWTGDLSGIVARTMPWWARMRYFPPRRLETMADWEEKIAAFAERAAHLDLRTIGGVPSWMLIFFDALARLRPDRGKALAAHFPNLELLVHGGVSFAPYRALFAELLSGSRAETREVYAASEGFLAVADRGDGEGMRLMLDTGLFFEFVPVEELDAARPTRHWAATIETGVNYAIVLSTCAGVWASVVGDTVRFVDTRPPRLLVSGRTSYTLSAFGEHLIGEEIETAVSDAAAAIGAQVTDFSVGPVYPAAGGDLGGHLYVVEFADGAPGAAALDRFAAAVDERLSALNDDYRAHRSGGYGMKAPHIHAVPPGTFAAWMKRRGQLGGQHKVPRIINDDALFANLRRFAGVA